MAIKRRTAAEQKFWDAAFTAAWDRCLQENGLEGAIGCAHLAAEAANAALAERRTSQKGEQP